MPSENVKPFTVTCHCGRELDFSKVTLCPCIPDKEVEERMAAMVSAATAAEAYDEKSGPFILFHDCRGADAETAKNTALCPYVEREFSDGAWRCRRTPHKGDRHRLGWVRYQPVEPRVILEPDEESEVGRERIAAAVQAVAEKKAAGTIDYSRERSYGTQLDFDEGVAVTLDESGQPKSR